jgi:ubiquitin-protein ligase E3 A
LEEVLQRNFTIDLESYGENINRPLKDGGEDILVTKQNRAEFVKLYIDCLFFEQCKAQILEFKKGFFRLFDPQLMKQLYLPDELEQFVCGSKTLDFKELKRVARYIKPLHPKHQLVLWFWEIVFEDFDDSHRHKLLAFTTGSDRVPITGLEDVEFIVGAEGDDEEKLPIAHTCFNQFIMPFYQSKQKLKEKLTLALENSEGFGMV